MLGEHTSKTILGAGQTGKMKIKEEWGLVDYAGDFNTVNEVDYLMNQSYV